MTMPEAPDPDRNFVASFARGLRVIHAFGNQHRPLTIAEVSHKTQIPRAAVRRLLHTLVALGYVRNNGSQFTLQAKTLQFAHDYLSSNALAIAGQLVVSKLSNEVHCFCGLAVLDGHELIIVCASNITSRASVDQVMPRLGNRMPLYCAAPGHVILGSFSEAELKVYFETVALKPFTYLTPVTPQAVRTQVEKVRSLVHALDDRTVSLKHRSMAAPIVDANGKLCAILMAIAQTGQFSTSALQKEVLPQLVQAAREMTAHTSPLKQATP